MYLASLFLMLELLCEVVSLPLQALSLALSDGEACLAAAHAQT